MTHDKELLAAIISRRGENLAAQGKWQSAQNEFNRARIVAPIDARPRTGYALVVVQLEPTRRADAIGLLQQVIADSPWYSAAYIALADFSESTKDFSQAEQWLKVGLEKNPNEPHLLFALAQLYARQKRVEDARATFTNALQFETHADDFQNIVSDLSKLESPK